MTRGPLAICDRARGSPALRGRSGSPGSGWVETSRRGIGEEYRNGKSGRRNLNKAVFPGESRVYTDAEVLVRRGSFGADEAALVQVKFFLPLGHEPIAVLTEFVGQRAPQIEAHLVVAEQDVVDGADVVAEDVRLQAGRHVRAHVLGAGDARVRWNVAHHAPQILVALARGLGHFELDAPEATHEALVLE